VRDQRVTTTQGKPEPESYQASAAGKKDRLVKRGKQKRPGFTKALLKVILLFEILKGINF
jgi:hypothetical protein